MKVVTTQTGITPEQSALVDSVARVASGQILVRSSTGVAGAGVLAVDTQELTGGGATTLHTHPHSAMVGDTADPVGVPDGWLYFQRDDGGDDGGDDSDADSVTSSESSSAQVTAGAASADSVGTSELSAAQVVAGAGAVEEVELGEAGEASAMAGAGDGEAMATGEASAVSASMGGGNADTVSVGESADAELVEDEPESNVIGNDGRAIFQALTSQQLADLATFKVYFVHKSVGGNILGDNDATKGTQHWGFDFATNYDSTAAFATSHGLQERLFDADNGQPLTKIAEFQTRVLTHGIGAALVASVPAGTRAVVGLKFCFTDLTSLNSATLPQIKADYLAMVNAVLAALPGVRIMHFAMPLGTANLWDLAQSHAARIDLFEWMQETFTDTDTHFFFNLHQVESTHADGSQASVNGLPVLCSEWADDNSGHLNWAGANWVAEAALGAWYTAATRA